MLNEILDYFEHSVVASTSSAFIQQREKILIEAWAFLFNSFNNACQSFSEAILYGYYIYAVYNPNVNIYRNPDDEDTFIHEGNRGYNAIHINALFDLLNYTYNDIVFSGKKKGS